MNKYSDESEDNTSYLQTLKDKLKRSVSHSCLYALEEDFNKCGLSLQTTTQNRMILCKIIENKPCHDEFLKDYIYLGNYGEDKELGKRLIECIIEFVEVASSDPSEIKNEMPSWQNNVCFYGKIEVMNEDIESISSIID